MYYRGGQTFSSLAGQISIKITPEAALFIKFDSISEEQNFFYNLYPISSFLVFFLNINGRKLSLCNSFQNDKRSKGRKNKLEGCTLATSVKWLITEQHMIGIPWLVIPKLPARSISSRFGQLSPILANRSSSQMFGIFRIRRCGNRPKQPARTNFSENGIG